MINKELYRPLLNAITHKISQKMKKKITLLRFIGALAVIFSNLSMFIPKYNGIGSPEFWQNFFLALALLIFGSACLLLAHHLANYDPDKIYKKYARDLSLVKLKWFILETPKGSGTYKALPLMPHSREVYSREWSPVDFNQVGELLDSDKLSNGEEVRKVLHYYSFV